MTTGHVNGIWQIANFDPFTIGTPQPIARNLSQVIMWVTSIPVPNLEQIHHSNDNSV